MITIKADNKLTKALVAIYNALNINYEIKKEKKKDKPYDPEFVKMVLERAENAKKDHVVEINPRDLWGSIGLK